MDVPVDDDTGHLLPSQSDAGTQSLVACDDLIIFVHDEGTGVYKLGVFGD